MEPGLQILAVNSVYFCASKLEAFRDRGKNDYLGSRDLEDVIAIVDGRSELAQEIGQASGDVRSYVAEEIGKLCATPEFLDALPGHLLFLPKTPVVQVERYRRLFDSQR